MSFACRLACVLLVGLGGWQALAHAKNPQVFNEQELAWIATHPVIKIAIDPDWRPLEYVENGTHKGLAAEYLKGIARVSGLKFQWVSGQDWPSARAGVLDGALDLIPATSERFATQQMRDHVYYTQPYFAGSTIIVTQAGSSVIFDPRQLKGKTVAVKGGGAYERMLGSGIAGINLLLVNTPEQALEKVAEGEAYAAVDIDAAFRPLLRQRFFNTLHVAGTIVEMPAVVSMGVSKGQPILFSVIEKSLAALTAQETDLMMSRWMHATDYGPPSWTAVLGYYLWEIALVGGLLCLVIVFAYRAYSAQRRAERSEKDKAMFLAVMSHEIRTPMNAILSSVELLGRSSLSADDARLAKVAVTSANTLLDLLNDVLDFSKIEAGKLILHRQPTDVQALIHEAVSIAAVRAEEKRLSLSAALTLPENLHLVIDAHRVRQVLINLLSNAIKFTEAGSVKVTATFTADPEIPAHGMLSVVVSDTGIGISKKQQARLFQAFSQADASTTRKFGGTGLGLTICSDLVKLMQGTITLQSELGKGTRFTVSLPVSAETVAPAVPGEVGLQVSDERLGASSLTVLVIEDHPENQFVIERQLSALGHRALQAECGQAGLDRWEAEYADIILLDCNLPDIDGYAVARRIREIEAQTGDHTPIIAISAMIGPEHEEACMSAGIDGVLAKPLRIDELRSVIEMWCDVQSPVSDAMEFEVSGSLYEQFLASTHLDLESLQRAVDAADWALAARIAHRIGGAALMVQQPRVAELARAVEQAEPAQMPCAVEQLVDHLASAV